MITAFAWAGWTLFVYTCLLWWAHSRMAATWKSLYHQVASTERKWRRMFFQTRAEFMTFARDVERKNGSLDLAEWLEGRRAHWDTLAKCAGADPEFMVCDSCKGDGCSGKWHPHNNGFEACSVCDGTGRINQPAPTVGQP